jgi:hypothetical protein
MNITIETTIPISIQLIIEKLEMYYFYRAKSEDVCESDAIRFESFSKIIRSLLIIKERGSYDV